MSIVFCWHSGNGLESTKEENSAVNSSKPTIYRGTEVISHTNRGTKCNIKKLLIHIQNMIRIHEKYIYCNWLERNVKKDSK